jgi:hypothetical protein
MQHGIQLFQPSLNGLGQEVALAEVPGELWSAVEELAERSPAMFIDYHPQELNTTNFSSRTVSIRDYLQHRNTTTGQDAADLGLLHPYIKEALDSGYNYVILAA